MQAIVSDTPQSLSALRNDLPVELPKIVARALEKDRNRRYDSAAELLKDLTACQAVLNKGSVDLAASRKRPALSIADVLHSASRKPKVVVSTLLLLALVGGFAGWSLNENAKLQRAREDGIQEARKLIERDEYAAALTVLRQVERVVPQDPSLRELWPKVLERSALCVHFR